MKALALLLAVSSCAAFSLTPAAVRSRAHAASAARFGAACMEMQELEFIIYPDGRVEERVLGVKGADCQALTREINKALGEVYETEATSEMFEQKVEVNVEEENSNTVGWSSEGSGSSGSSW